MNPIAAARQLLQAATLLLRDENVTDAALAVAIADTRAAYRILVAVEDDREVDDDPEIVEMVEDAIANPSPLTLVVRS